MLRVWGAALLLLLLSMERSHALCSGQSVEQRVIFEDRFTDRSGGWDEDADASIGGGEMVISLKSGDTAHTLLNSRFSVRAGDFCMQFKLPEPNSDSGTSASMVFWADDNDNLYSADFWSNGSLSIGQSTNGKWQEAVAMDDANRAWTGPEQVFELRVVAADGHVKTWLNGALIKSLDMPAPRGNFHFGAFVEMDKAPPDDKIFRFQYFNVLQVFNTFGGGPIGGTAPPPGRNGH
jgi:hypothetical protein